MVQSHAYPSESGDITLVKISNALGHSVTLSSLGAGIIEVIVPDRDGNLENIALSYENPDDYLNDGPCMGKTPGRYANRIAKGHLEIDGKIYNLPINNGPNHLHGGPEGFQNRIWDTELLSNGVRFTLKSVDGDQNYPAAVEAAVEYRWSDEDELSISFEAKSDAPSVINLTNHTYWNLNGADSGSALDHLLQIKASGWLPTDETLVPTGEIAEVEGTPMDFLTMKAVGKDINDDFPALKFGKGYDNCWVLDRQVEVVVQPDGSEEWIQSAMVKDAVILRSEKSGRELHVDTNQPGVQIYSGNWLAGSPANVSGRSYNDYDGIAIEAQGLPDAPNHPNFPSQYISPDQPYRRQIIYRFK